jgi:hypothetical protein
MILSYLAFPHRYYNEKYIILWALEDIIKLNKTYNIEEFVPSFFLFGSDGGDTAYLIIKDTRHIFEAPFIGMSEKAVMYICETYKEFIGSSWEL